MSGEATAAKQDLAKNSCLDGTFRLKKLALPGEGGQRAIMLKISRAPLDSLIPWWRHDFGAQVCSRSAQNFRGVTGICLLRQLEVCHGRPSE
ncbi:MAG: hypothetical protein KGJ62_02290 [Armatimonadetes bacterium]|nr:hypothetical protein [Armatimonadota bacterium]MDE2205350.1 hypothetical protein [Armatimonadota bacterium]